MGAGDWLMATSQVKTLNEETDLPVLVVDPYDKVQWHDVFNHNKRIVRTPDYPHVKLVNASGARPYIAAQTSTRFIWKSWDIKPGEMVFNESEKAFGRRHPNHVLIEPNTKVPNSNKSWPFMRWQKVVDSMPEVTFLQVGGIRTRRLKNVMFLDTFSFRQAAVILSYSRAFVGSEGGLHHAAAALGVPAVVLFSEYISPDITGYPVHRNLRHAGLACGSRLPCDGCRISLKAISVEEVVENLKEILNVSVPRNMATG